jgi:hypothetical protein
MTGTIAALTVLLLTPAPQPETSAIPKVNIRQALASLDYSRLPIRRQAPDSAAPQPAKQRSTGRKVAGALLGGAGGFFAGAFIGEGLRRECSTCEPSPLPTGAIIGAPIGAIIGGILGAKFL